MHLSGEGSFAHLFASELPSGTVRVKTSLRVGVPIIIVRMVIAEVDVEMNLIAVLKLLSNVWQLLCVTHAAQPATGHHIMTCTLLLLEVEWPPPVAVDDPRAALDGLQSECLLLRLVAHEAQGVTYGFKVL